MARLNVAVIGCGWVADSHVDEGVGANPTQFDVAACCDLNAVRAEQFGARHRIGRWMTDPHEIFAMPEIDVIALCTPPSTHFPLMQAALAAGKHVICEKPLTSSLALVDAAIAAEQRSIGRVMPVFQYRFGDGIERARHVIQSGLAGRLNVASVETAKRRGADYYRAAAWRGKFATELGGVLLTQAIHNHDLLLWLLGPVAAVAAFKTTRVNPIEVEDCAVASLLMQDGALASSTATLGSTRQLTRFRLCFENVCIEREAYDESSASPGDEPWRFIPADERIGLAIEAKAAELQPEKRGFARQYELFHHAVTTGGEMPVTLQDARRSLELVTGIFHAADTGTTVELPIGTAHPKYSGWLSPAPAEVAA